MNETDAAAGPLWRGLTRDEVAVLRARYGANELPRTASRGVFRIAFETLREPMFLLMLGAAVLYLLLGDVSEGAFLVAAAAAALGLVIIQENRSERALAALRDLAQPQAHVIRDGQTRQLPASEVVPGDIVLIAEGDRVPADAWLLSGDVLRVDESTLTGESAPVVKKPQEWDGPHERAVQPGAAVGPHLFAGTLISNGEGVALVERTGAASVLGQIGASLAAIEIEPTPLQKVSARLVRLLGGAALMFCAIVTVAYGVIRHDWIEGALAGITAAIALVPEEFPMVLAVFLAVGAWRLAVHRVLVRRTSAIEALGAATVLCVDKTGTLTENRMRVARLWWNGGTLNVEPGAALEQRPLELLQIAGLASAVRPLDPMDRAIRERLAREPLWPARLSSEPVRSWPLDPKRLAVVHAWATPGGRHVIAAKGAPEAVAELCRIAGGDRLQIMDTVERFAADGLRVLGVCVAESGSLVPDEPAQMKFRFIGMIGFMDPLRSDVASALEEVKGAGVSVFMITGDHPATALAVARAAGIPAGEVLTGAEIDQLPFPALRDRLRRVSVFARVMPEQKLLLVEALKADGEVVVMTGDGVNDAPALQAAHIGVAMGRKGTDVAREAAALVLLDDGFASIVAGVRLGRRIFANLRRALTYVSAIHVPIAGLALVPILLGLPPMLFPMHVALLELAIDPICALVFEGEPSEVGAMKQPPRASDEPVFGLSQLGVALVQGGLMLVSVFALYAWALRHGPTTEARGAAFAALVLGNLGLALVDAFSSAEDLFAPHRRPYWFIAATALVLLALVFIVPWGANTFQVAPPPIGMVVAAAGIVVGILIAAGMLRLGRRAFPVPANPRASGVRDA